MKYNTKKSLAIVCVYFLCAVIKRPLPTINVIYVMKNIVMLMLGTYQGGKKRSHINELQTQNLCLYVCLICRYQPACVCVCVHTRRC